MARWRGVSTGRRPWAGGWTRWSTGCCSAGSGSGLRWAGRFRCGSRGGGWGGARVPASAGTVVDGVLLGGVGVGLALGGTFPLWLAAVIVARYVLPAIGGLVLISLHRRPELRHTLSGQISTALIIVLGGGICLFRFFNQDASNVVVGAEVVIPIATVATFLHLAWVARRPVAAPEPG